jgi:hypothetical protein
MASLASGVAAGTKITASTRVPAAMVASADAALPVEATARVDVPVASAHATTMADARSLNDAEGSRPSSFSQIRRWPRSASSRGARYSGDQPIVPSGVGTSAEPGGGASGSSGP